MKQFTLQKTASFLIYFSSLGMFVTVGNRVLAEELDVNVMISMDPQGAVGAFVGAFMWFLTLRATRKGGDRDASISSTNSAVSSR